MLASVKREFGLTERFPRNGNDFLNILHSNQSKRNLSQSQQLPTTSCTILVGTTILANSIQSTAGVRRQDSTNVVAGVIDCTVPVG
jgi:hypothetical protein